MVAVLAALNVVTDSFAAPPEVPSGVWYSWNFLVTPLTGVILGATYGFVATSVGVLVGHFIYFIDGYEFFFTIGAPVGVAVTALVYENRWKPVLGYYILLLAAYWSSPIAWQLQSWAMWDTYLAFLILVATTVFGDRFLKKSSRNLSLRLVLAAFIGLEADVLFRIFLLVPAGTYQYFYGWDIETLRAVWVSGAIGTPLKVALSTFATVVIGKPIVDLIKTKLVYAHVFDS
ncbi:MAG: hypothetical protein JSV35_02010 [Candidatus Bathyarchaeota archaeon]|nr:MAG: hypothetical protein JSV35_02010 [Candidatus Bathyarchaeota archaeon]